MFRITNNNISITRGETATYDAVFKHSDGTPLTLDKNLVADDKSVYGLFSVKLSMYDEDAVFRVPMKLDDLATFDTSADIIDIGDETFSDINVPDAYSKFVDSNKYKLLGFNSVAVYNTDTANFPFVCKNSNKLYYFKNSTQEGVTQGLYEYTNANVWSKNTTLTNDIPYYFYTNNQSSGAVVWYIGNNTYISGFFNVNGTPTYKTYLFDDSAENAFEEIVFTGVTDFRASYIWDDGTNVYYYKSSSGSYKTYVLNQSTYEFTQTSIDYAANPSYIWKDASGVVFYTKDNDCKKWDKTNTSWVNISSNISFSDITSKNKPFLVKDKVYYEDKVLVTSSTSLVFEDLETSLNKTGTVWHYNNDWMCTAANPKSGDIPGTYDLNNRIAIDSVDSRSDKLYKRTIAGVPYYYQYVGNSETVTEDDFEEYEFRLVFPFPYNIMKTLQPKLYKYEIALVGGTPTGIIANQEPVTTLPLTIDFKKYLVEFKDFKVEGSLSE